MAIVKLAKNMSVTVTNNYTVVAAKLQKSAESVKIDATKNNLMLNCIKKICAVGETKYK
ncbi:MAG TPA: hypothetical protein VF581_01090 [Flavobacterium sp.]|jgi:hypothetical protein